MSRHEKGTDMETITLNGRIFTKGKAAMTETLFTSGPTASGYYWRVRGAVVLFTPTGERVGGINRAGVLHSSRKASDGRWWHSYGTPTIVGENPSYAAGVCEARAAVGLPT